MLTTKKVRLKLTPEQEIQFRKSCGVARWVYNYLLSEKQRVYDEYISNGKTGKKTISEGEVRKYINNVLKPTTHQWLKEVGSNVMKQAVKDADNAYKNFFNGLSKRPKFKSKKSSKQSFYVNYESLTRINGGFKGEKLGFVKTSEPLPKLADGEKYANPRITFDGKYWYLSVVYNIEPKSVQLTNESLGIDLGVKNLAICSNGVTYKNINKSKRVKALKRTLKREQRKLSRKIECNIIGYANNRKPIFRTPLQGCKNIQKQIHYIKLINRKINSIRNNHLHQATAEIVKTKPFQIVMETLNITGMMKNKHLAKAIAEEKLFEFKRQIKYKAEMYGIKVVEVPTFYPSSKTCSVCGCINTNLKLSDRVYHCDSCGITLDRDLNAAINLANYKVI